MSLRVYICTCASSAIPSPLWISFSCESWLERYQGTSCVPSASSVYTCPASKCTISLGQRALSFCPNPLCCSPQTGQVSQEECPQEQSTTQVPQLPCPWGGMTLREYIWHLLPPLHQRNWILVNRVVAGLRNTLNWLPSHVALSRPPAPSDVPYVNYLHFNPCLSVFSWGGPNECSHSPKNMEVGQKPQDK